jgi:hypothetical protein
MLLPVKKDSQLSRLRQHRRRRLPGVSYICLQLNRRRSAGHGTGKTPPTIAREARRPTRGTPEESEESAPRLRLHGPVCSLMTLAYFLFRFRNYSAYYSGFRAVLRAGVTGRTQAVQAPLTPRPRGTIYDALPFPLDILERKARQGWVPEEDMTMSVERRTTIHDKRGQ